jgi:hypothetical protein
VVLFTDVLDLEFVRKQVVAVGLEVGFLGLGVIELVVGNELALGGGLDVAD